MKKLMLIGTMVIMLLGSFASKSLKADPGPEQLCLGRFNGQYGYQYCAGVGDIGYYVTTRGELKNIKCNIPGYPVAKACYFIPSPVFQ